MLKLIIIFYRVGKKNEYAIIIVIVMQNRNQKPLTTRILLTMHGIVACIKIIIAIVDDLNHLKTQKNVMLSTNQQILCLIFSIVK